MASVHKPPTPRIGELPGRGAAPPYRRSRKGGGEYVRRAGTSTRRSAPSRILYFSASVLCAVSLL